MFFLLRMAFWLSIVLILLPSGSSQPVKSPNDIHAAEAISAASATVQDMKGFCARQPEACSVGSQVAVSLGYRAQAGARMLYDFLHETLTSREGNPNSRAGSNPQATGTSVNASQNTLTSADLAPPWRGPQPRKDAKHAA